MQLFAHFYFDLVPRPHFVVLALHLLLMSQDLNRACLQILNL